MDAFIKMLFLRFVARSLTHSLAQSCFLRVLVVFFFVVALGRSAFGGNGGDGVV